jgi:hypothetical protein
LPGPEADKENQAQKDNDAGGYQPRWVRPVIFGTRIGIGHVWQ